VIGAGNVVIGNSKKDGTVNVVSVAATYCSDSLSDKELLALDMIKNIMDFDYLQY